MKFKLLIFNIILFFCLNTINIVTCVGDTLLSNRNMNVEIKNVDIVYDQINLKKYYDEYAIITIKITNMSLEDIELTNINYYIYQDNKRLETFIKSDNDEYLGLIGKLSSGESRVLKIYVALDYNESPIKLKLKNLSTPEEYEYENIINL